jgi:ferredoxin-NADP reductase
LPTPVKLPARVAEVLVHAEDLRSYVLVPARPAPAFRPGQFLHLALDAWDPSAHWPESRVFSIASSPLQRARLRITVSRQGAFTTRMFEELEVDSSVWLKLPYGAFSPDPTRPGRVVLLAGGSGITPFVSFLEWVQERHPKAAIDLHYGARSPNLLIYREQVTQSGLANLRVRCYAEEIPEEQSGEGVVLGSLSAHAAWEALPDPRAAHFYLSGPKAMIDTFRRDLLALGARPEAVLSDDWE